MWIESHQELRHHPKTKRLARVLRICTPQAVGHLHFLWWWCLSYAQDGDLSAYEIGEIADAAEWDGDPSVFFAALVNSGFIDVAGEEEHYTVHDWQKYGGKLIDRRTSDAERKRIARAHTGSPQDIQRTSNGHPQAVRTLSDVDNKTIDNRREDHRTQEDPVISDHDPETTTTNRSLISIPREEAGETSAYQDAASPAYRQFVRTQLCVFGLEKPSPKTLDSFAVILYPFVRRDVERVRAQCIVAAEWLAGPNNKRKTRLSTQFLLNWMDRNFNPQPQPPQQTPGSVNHGTNSGSDIEAARQTKAAARERRINNSGARLARIEAGLVSTGA